MFNDLVSQRTIEQIIQQKGIRVTNDTTPEELLEIVKVLLVETINSIDETALHRAVMEKLERELRRMGRF